MKIAKNLSGRNLCRLCQALWASLRKISEHSLNHSHFIVKYSKIVIDLIITNSKDNLEIFPHKSEDSVSKAMTNKQPASTNPNKIIKRVKRINTLMNNFYKDVLNSSKTNKISIFLLIQPKLLWWTFSWLTHRVWDTAFY